MSVISSNFSENPTYFLSNRNQESHLIIEELNRIFAIECIINLCKGKVVYSLIETPFKYKVSDLTPEYRETCVRMGIPSDSILDTQIDCDFIKEKTKQAFRNARIGNLNVRPIHYPDDREPDMYVFQGYRITIDKP